MNRSSRSPKCFVPLAFSWSHDGAVFRVTPWPEVQFERSYDSEWIAAWPSADALAAGASQCSGPAWQRYLEFVPAEVRELLRSFRTGRLAALRVAACCPDMMAVLIETPVLAVFQVEQGWRWREANAVYERGGVFGLLEWLGLPASRRTLSVLQGLCDPDPSQPAIARLRRLLWDMHAGNSPGARRMELPAGLGEIRPALAA